MGIAKAAWMEELEREYDLPGGHICAECVKDDWLKQWVTDEASCNSCSFCGSAKGVPIAASFNDFIGCVMAGVRYCWNHPDDEGIMYISAEGGYQASISNNYDVFWDLDVSDNESVVEALINAVEDNGWVSRGYYTGNESDWLENGWDRFKQIIKHHSRFFFLRPNDKENSFWPEIEPHEMLDRIANVVTGKLGDYDLIRTLDEKKEVVRVRLDANEKYHTASALGTPPVEFAIRSNRMSPAGVPMFYGAFDFDTALAETYDAEVSMNAIVSVGRFRPLRELRVLDLSNLPDLPSIFDEARNNLIHALSFLHSFARDVSKPIERDGREHIEYVPTQIVTEYFRRVFRVGDNFIDGIVYRSSRANGSDALVLFCENEQCIDGDPTGKDGDLLQLISVEHSVVSDHGRIHENSGP